MPRSKTPPMTASGTTCRTFRRRCCWFSEDVVYSRRVLTRSTGCSGLGGTSEATPGKVTFHPGGLTVGMVNDTPAKSETLDNPQATPVGGIDRRGPAPGRTRVGVEDLHPQRLGQVPEGDPEHRAGVQDGVGDQLIGRQYQIISGIGTHAQPFQNVAYKPPGHTDRWLGGG
jgi:hypothetical protein